MTTRFRDASTRGLSADCANVAVCLAAGTEVAFEKDVEYRWALGFLPRRKITERVARFRQIDKEDPNAHHDALEFPSGRVVLITRLLEGQPLTVLQMPVLQTVESDPAPDRTNRERVASMLIGRNR
ncbi:MAG: hypothetical protein ACRD36_11100 [Candidatus Acidiferrum sp.]